MYSNITNFLGVKKLTILEKYKVWIYLIITHLKGNDFVVKLFVVSGNLIHTVNCPQSETICFPYKALKKKCNQITVNDE